MEKKIGEKKSEKKKLEKKKKKRQKLVALKTVKNMGIYRLDTLIYYQSVTFT